MLVHLRRSIVMAVLCLVFLGFVYALAGVGLSQLLFKHQANGSITANGSTLIGQNWSQTKCPGHLVGQLRVPGSARRPRPLRRLAEPGCRRGGQPPPGQQRPRQARHPESGESGASNLGSPFQHPEGQHRDPGRLLGQAGGRTRRRTWSPPRAVATTPTSPQPTHWLRSPWSRGPPASLRRPCGHSIARQNNGAQLGFLGSSYINVLQLNEALAKLR